MGAFWLGHGYRRQGGRQEVGGWEGQGWKGDCGTGTGTGKGRGRGRGRGRRTERSRGIRAAKALRSRWGVACLRKLPGYCFATSKAEGLGRSWRHRLLDSFWAISMTNCQAVGFGTCRPKKLPGSCYTRSKVDWGLVITRRGSKCRLHQPW